LTTITEAIPARNSRWKKQLWTFLGAIRGGKNDGDLAGFVALL